MVWIFSPCRDPFQNWVVVGDDYLSADQRWRNCIDDNLYQRPMYRVVVRRKHGSAVDQA